VFMFDYLQIFRVSTEDSHMPFSLQK